MPCSKLGYFIALNNKLPMYPVRCFVVFLITRCQYISCFRLRHFSGHDSAKAGIDLQQPPVIFITDTNSTCAPSHKCISETESVYDELGAIEEDVRYQSFSKISPRYNRRLDRRVTERSGDIAVKQSPGQDDYVELTPDYLEVSGPNKCLPDWIPDADYLTPK